MTDPRQGSAESPTPAANPSSEEAWPDERKAWYAVFVFSLALLCDFIDRGIVTLLVPAIKADLQLSDTQMGFLLGFAFIFFYAFLGLPIARLVDSKSRRLVMACGIATWSVMTGLCGLAQNFWQLFIARVGVGVGEACNGPSTYSMMADLFPREKLTRAISVLQLGTVYGMGLGSIIGGGVLYMVSHWPPVEVPVLGPLKPWQLTFMIVGFPGVLIAMLLATVEEPKRRGRLTQATGKTSHKAIPIQDVGKFLRANWKVYAPMFVGLGIGGLGMGAASWGPTFFYRTYGWETSEFAVYSGILTMTISPFGLYAGTRLAEWYMRNGYDDANMRLVIVTHTVAIPLGILYPLMPNPYLALGVMGLATFIRMMGPGAQNAALQVITPNEMRGQITALYLFIFNMVGYGLGPVYVAVLTDYVFGAEDQLRYALATSAAIVSPLSTLILWLGMKPYGEAYARAKAWR